MLEIKNTITEVKNVFNGVSRLSTAEYRIFVLKKSLKNNRVEIISKYDKHKELKEKECIFIQHSFLARKLDNIYI